MSGSDTPADLYRLSPVSNWRSSRTTEVDFSVDRYDRQGPRVVVVDRASRSTTEQLLVGAGRAGAKRFFLHHARQLLVCTRCGLFARREAPRSSSIFSPFWAESFEQKIGWLCPTLGAVWRRRSTP
eukprot:4203437-Pleurochrysis_carterae.AAC.1